MTVCVLLFLYFDILLILLKVSCNSIHTPSLKVLIIQKLYYYMNNIKTSIIPAKIVKEFICYTFKRFLISALKLAKSFNTLAMKTRKGA